MDNETYQYLQAKVFGDKDFVAIMTEKMTEYIRRRPSNEMETIALYAKVQLLQDLIDTGKNIIRQGVKNENSTQNKQ